MVFGEGQQSSNKNTEKCRGMYGREKNRRIKRNPNVSYGENRRIHGKKRGTSDSGRRGRILLDKPDKPVNLWVGRPLFFHFR